MPRSLGFHHLLVPVSDNVESEQAIDVACRLAAEHGATIVAVSVIEVLPVLPLDAHMTADEAIARHLLRRAAAIADSYGVHLVSRVLRARDAATAIVEQAEERATEVILIGAPRKPRRPFGSTVKHVLKHSPCAVMVIGAAQSEVLAEHAAA